MELLEELTALRSTLKDLCEKTDRMIEACQANAPSGSRTQETTTDRVQNFESIYPLCMEPGFFKGKSVVAVIFPDGVRIETPTWKKFVEVVMKRCNHDAGKHAGLMELRNRVQGRSRQLLGNGTAGMRSPIKIDRGLYMEAHYDTETLLRIMKIRILDAVGYDYRSIQVAIRNQ